MKSQAFINELIKLKEKIGKEKQALLNSKCMQMPTMSAFGIDKLKDKPNAMKKAYKDFEKAKKDYDVYWKNPTQSIERLAEIEYILADIDSTVNSQPVFNPTWYIGRN